MERTLRFANFIYPCLSYICHKLWNLISTVTGIKFRIYFQSRHNSGLTRLSKHLETILLSRILLKLTRVSKIRPPYLSNFDFIINICRKGTISSLKRWILPGEDFYRIIFKRIFYLCIFVILLICPSSFLSGYIFIFIHLLLLKKKKKKRKNIVKYDKDIFTIIHLKETFLKIHNRSKLGMQISRATCEFQSF